MKHTYTYSCCNALSPCPGTLALLLASPVSADPMQSSAELGVQILRLSQVPLVIVSHTSSGQIGIQPSRMIFLSCFDRWKKIVKGASHA